MRPQLLPWPAGPQQQAAAALTAYGSGRGSEHAALTALASSRLLVPVTATVSGIVRERGSAREGGGAGHVRADGGDRGAEMSVPTLIGRDGRPAGPAFTCPEGLARCAPEARTSPAPATQVWRTPAHA